MVFPAAGAVIALLKLINLGCRFVAAVKALEAFGDWVSYIFVAVVVLVVTSRVVWTCSMCAGWC